jgi:putative alpha-1,2-mannosidase
MNTDRHRSAIGIQYSALSILLLLIAYCLPLIAQTKDFTRWVNPFIGTGGHGHTFPGATLPFGMVQLSPDTRIDNWDGSSGYHYSDDIIYGFSHTHLSGTGIPDGCDILFLPTVGSSSITGPSKFSHANERAEPGYYSVKLDRSGVIAELTATARVGMHRYNFPKTNEANIALDLGWRDKVIDSELKTVGDRRIEGFDARPHGQKTRRFTSSPNSQSQSKLANFRRRQDNVWRSQGNQIKGCLEI